MKKISILLLSFTALIFLPQCHDMTSENHTTEAGVHHGKDISAMMNNEAYMNEVMDSMRTRHPDVILSTLFVITKDNKEMQGNMLDKMTDMCNMDSSMCKMMMGKTMAMADADQTKCNMMMDSMKSRPNVMKAMQGMCNMKGMKTEQKK